MGEIAERLVLDLPGIAEAAPQEMRRIHAALVAAPCGDDMYCAAAFCHALNIRHSSYLSNSLVTTLCTNKKRSNALQTAKNKGSADYGRIKIGKNFSLVSAVVLAKVDEGVLAESVLRGWLDGALERADDRALFGLPVL